MKFELHADEHLIKEGPANLQKGLETVGGKLRLTNQRLVFEAHAVNIQKGTTEIPLSTVQTTEKCWTKFLGIIPMVPNSLAVHTNNGTSFRFVLFGRDAWASDIAAQTQA